MECPICFKEIIDNNACFTNCNHIFCYECLNKWFNKKRVDCPMCRSSILFFSHNNEKNRIIIIKNESNNQNNQNNQNIQNNLNNINPIINNNTVIINIKLLFLLKTMSTSSIILLFSTMYLFTTNY